MSEHIDATEKDLFWVTTLVSNSTTRLGYLAIALFIGHRSFNLPDYGITFWHLLAIGFGGAIAIWITLAVEGWRVDKAINRGLRSAGFTEKEIDQLS